ncbi:hypothetical protein K458DRAFT_188466 [Lentithecium fluviatile CBS 122367]|uniref:F-box domain-containing protein n=1 Tax=Lentithecium fluviatile CBS 122367 TaxID=1168545 RepID=A0A6G1J9N7_9PLEO|nr:hypothetical protein K458DRAFT_188466 [Lentithecium fluviatile CBS 122367]
MDTLPNEIIEEVGWHLDTKDVKSLRLVSRRMRDGVQTEYFRRMTNLKITLTPNGLQSFDEIAHTSQLLHYVESVEFTIGDSSLDVHAWLSLKDPLFRPTDGSHLTTLPALRERDQRVDHGIEDDLPCILRTLFKSQRLKTVKIHSEEPEIHWARKLSNLSRKSLSNRLKAIAIEYAEEDFEYEKMDVPSIYTELYDETPQAVGYLQHKRYANL